ncbi:PilZ domain-containing protein [Sphingomonas sp. UV9]|uniref:PilZ domain-containing protein n=1 Tax=Sphingomonas sp. UV9 TaxID=1851410 RepID=UPI000FFCB22E|nr:PilZ domain-containing protein [Sphingomonas sp. UV9]RXD06902.1 PilZ domain-containing protein [Sphingomonas sp. UV9]
MTRHGQGSSGADIDGGNRQRARDSLLLTAQIRLDSEPGLREVRVRNLSAGGLMIELDEAADVGTQIMIMLHGVGEVGGKVAWCTEGRIGIALDSLIDPSKVGNA